MKGHYIEFFRDKQRKISTTYGIQFHRHYKRKSVISIKKKKKIVNVVKNNPFLGCSVVLGGNTLNQNGVPSQNINRKSGYSIMKVVNLEIQ